MNLKTEDLKNIFLKYISNKQTISSPFCPSVNEIMKSLRFPSRKTIKTMNHILDCPKCLPLFIFLKEIAKAEEDLINSIKEIRTERKCSQVNKKTFLAIRFSNFVPYAAITLLVILISFSVIKYISFSEKHFIRSSGSGTHLLLIEADISKETCTSYLKWNKIPQAKSYLIHIFDSSLVRLWSTTLTENKSLLPAEICEKIKAGEHLAIYFEAKEEEGKVIYNWLGELSSIQIISGRK